MFLKNRWMLGAVLLVSVSGSALVPRTSHAILGLATGNIPMAIAGGCLLALAPSVSYGSIFLLPRQPALGLTGLFLFGVIGGNVGLVLLPNSSGYGYHYGAIRTEELKDKFGLTDEQARSFNQDRFRVNAIVNEIQGKIAALSKPEDEQVLNLSRDIWSARLPGLAKDTRVALEKINSFGSDRPQSEAQ